MEMLIDILNKAYSTGYSITKEVTIPWLNQKMEITVVVTAKTPTTFNFTSRKDGGIIKFTNGPQIHVNRLGLTTTLTSIDFTADRIIFGLSGCPDWTYSLKK